MPFPHYRPQAPERADRRRVRADGEVAPFVPCLREAAKELDIKLTSIIQSCDNKYLEVKKPYYFRYAADGNINIPRCIGAYNYDTDELFGMYYNCQNAADETGYSRNTINHQVNKNRKPKRKFNNIYFLAIYRN